MADFRPSDVVLFQSPNGDTQGSSIRPADVRQTAFMPLGGTLGRSELECAAALAIWTLQRNGDVWRRVWHDEVEACLRVDAFSGAEPIRSWCRNPFFRPDLVGLHARHFAVVTEHAVELTELALLPIGQRWLRKRGA